MAKLVLFLADGTAIDIPLRRERITIGRRADNDVCLPNLAVSGEHAAVVTILDDSFLEDLGSTNGTLVSGKAIAKHFLRDGDRIDIGRHKLVYCEDDAAVLAPQIPEVAARSLRDLGERVEAAQPFARLKAEQASAPAPIEQTARQRAIPVATKVFEVPGPALPPPASTASIKILSGPNAGRAIALTKDQTTIGRPGIQVAAIVQASDTYTLKVLEGAHPPLINGKPAGADEVSLHPGDVIEIAATRLEFLGPPSVQLQAQPVVSALAES